MCLVSNPVMIFILTRIRFDPAHPAAEEEVVAAEVAEEEVVAEVVEAVEAVLFPSQIST